MATAVDSPKPRESTALRTFHGRRIVEYWHLLSLDAPTVAALWSVFFARAMHIGLPWYAPLLLALGTWIVYVADRILDGARAFPTTPLRERHLFHARNRNAFLAVASGVGGFLIWLIVARMSANARYEDTVLFSAALLYLMLVHKPRLGGISWLPKELAVGAVFAAATAVPTWSRLGPERTALFPAVAIFAILCWLNCVAIERWENASSSGDLRAPDAHITTRWTARHFQFAALSLAALSVIFAGIVSTAFGIVAFKNSAPACLAAAAAALILAYVDHRRKNLPRLHLRIAADLALLTPVLFLPFLS